MCVLPVHPSATALSDDCVPCELRTAFYCINEVEVILTVHRR
jgi:hypothetical protein